MAGKCPWVTVGVRAAAQSAVKRRAASSFVLVDTGHVREEKGSSHHVLVS